MSALAGLLGSPAAPTWLAPLLLAALKSAVLLLAVLLLHHSLRPASASLRHLVLSVALAASLALPLASAVLPAWRLPVLPGSPAAALPAPAAAGAAPPVARASDAAFRSVAVPEPTPGGERRLPPLPVLLVWLWGAGAALLLARLGVGMLQLRALTRRARPLEEDGWAEMAQRLGAHLGLTRAVPLRLCDADVVPMVWGVLRPVILLPPAAAEWAPERREVVLLHELSHVKRRDPLAHLVGQLCHAVYWPNPLVWMALSRLRDERERACDDHVLAAGADPADYAGHVLQIVRTFGRGMAASPALAMARRSQFEGRMLAILDPALRRRRVSPAAVSGTTAMMLAGLLPLAAMTPVAALPDAGRFAGAEAREAPRRGSIAPPADSLPLQVSMISGQYRIPEDLARDIVLAARAERLPVEAAVLLVRVESEFQEHRVSPRGAVGLTQMLPSTAAALQPGVSAPQLEERTTNLRLGFRYLRNLLARYDGDMAAALTAYHAGPRAADRLRAAGEDAAQGGRQPGTTADVRRAAGPQPRAGSVERIESAGDRAAFLLEVLRGPMGEARMLEAIRATEHIGSDGDRRRVLSGALARGGMGDAGLAALLGSAARIGSDGDKAAVLHDFLDRNGLPDALLDPFFGAARTIGSDGDLAGVLRKTVARGDGEPMLGRVLGTVLQIGSDGDKAAVLSAVAARGPLGEALHHRYVAAAESLGSSGDRERALAALVRGRAAPTADAGDWTTVLDSSGEVDGVPVRVATRARDVVLRRDGTGIDSILPGGLLSLEETTAGTTRRITVARGNGSELRHEYRVDGRLRPYDAGAQRWFSLQLQRLHRTMKGRTRI